MIKNLIITVKLEESVVEKFKTPFQDCAFEQLENVEDAVARLRSGDVRKYVFLLNGDIHEFSRAFPNNNLVVKTGSDEEVKKLEGQIKWILSDFGREYPLTDNTFFTSDTHFSHGNIIKYCDRPWNSGKDESGNIVVNPEDVAKMDEAMIDNWNRTVGKDDVVWHLGDFSFGGKTNIERIFPRLNGKINLVLGNHDHYGIKYYYDLGFMRVYDRPVLIGNFIVLSHAPLEWVKAPMFNLYGHVHANKIYNTWSANGCCMCVERHGYAPVSWKTIRENYEKLNGAG